MSYIYSRSRRFLCRPTALFFVTRAVGRQRALHTENSGFALYYSVLFPSALLLSVDGTVCPAE
jgi:hypothetical protein